MKNSSEPATFRLVVQCHLVPHTELYSSFKQLVMLLLLTVPYCYRQLDSSVQLLCCLMMGQYGPKHVADSAFCNINVNLTQLCAILGGLNYIN